MHEKDISTWNTLLTGYVQHGENKYTLYLFHQIQKEIKPDRVAFLPVLSACINLSGREEGKLIHSRIIAHSLMSDVIVCTSLVNMYAKCGSLEDARAVFSIMQHEDVIAWNAILAACAQHGEDLEAFNLFREMQREGINPNKVTFVNILGPFGGLALLTQGRLAHTVIVKARFNSDVVIGNALINMYGKGGSLEDALAIFEEMPQRDLVTWNAVILAYARHGMGYEVLQLLHWMHWDGAKPDEVTLVNILCACSHAGLLNEAQHYFVSRNSI